MAKVSVDLQTGTATVAGLEITVGEHPDGLRLHGPDGPVLRALSFGQRRFAVRAAEGCPDPADALARSVGYLALGRDPADAAVEALALFLAGASEDGGGPGLTEAALAVLRVTGWTATELDAADAAAVDDLARGLIPAAPGADDGWTRLQLAPATVDETRAELAADLLSRAARRPVAEEYGRTAPPPSTMDGPLPRSMTPGAGPDAPPSAASEGMAAAHAPPAADPSTTERPGTRLDYSGDDSGGGSVDGLGARRAARTAAKANGTARPAHPTYPAGPAFGEPDAEPPRFPMSQPTVTGPEPGSPTAADRAAHPSAGNFAQPSRPAGPARPAHPTRPQGTAHRPSGTVRRLAPPLPPPGTWAPIPKHPGVGERAGTLITGPWAPLAEGVAPPAVTPSDHWANGGANGDPILRLVTDDEDLAERLARVLHDEADLRGMAP